MVELPNILLKVDNASMLNSVENRAPFLSKKLLNFSIDLPTNKNFKLLSNRYLMKKIFKGAFDKEPNIKKHGFAFNKSVLLKNEKLIKKNIKDNFLINKNFFYSKYKDYLNGNMHYEQYLWNEMILNFSRQNLERTN